MLGRIIGLVLVALAVGAARLTDYVKLKTEPDCIFTSTLDAPG